MEIFNLQLNGKHTFWSILGNIPFGVFCLNHRISTLCHCFVFNIFQSITVYVRTVIYTIYTVFLFCKEIHCVKLSCIIQYPLFSKSKFIGAKITYRIYYAFSILFCFLFKKILIFLYVI